MKTYYQNEVLEFNKETISILKNEKVKLYFDNLNEQECSGYIKEIVLSDNTLLPYILIIRSLDEKELQIGINSINKIEIL